MNGKWTLLSRNWSEIVEISLIYNLAKTHTNTMWRFFLGFLVFNIGLTNEESIKLFTAIYILLHISKWKIIKIRHKYKHTILYRFVEWQLMQKYISFTIVSIHHGPCGYYLFYAISYRPYLYVTLHYYVFFLRKKQKRNTK